MVERRLSVQRQQIQDPAAGLHRRAAKRLPAPGNGEIDAPAAQFDLALPRQAAVLPGRRIGLPRRAAPDSCSGAGPIRNSERFRRPALLLALLTTAGPAVKLVPMKAKLISRFRDVADDDSLIEMVVWHVPVPVPPSGHCYKYRLVYVVAGQRVIGFDNERGKGDHHHVGSAELPYVFQGVDRLIDDFVEEVERWKREH
ncbi:DUF6516 family protein [Accumulibacter sp.]|uniref:toxin-antitoxin system TumE family protein n=1 Tax=Accumulibacter sp. TaxID=2053492 RepID=UPI002D1FBA2E|nr:DUF6516 family protein [Accumulibacter sp.]